MPLREEGDRYTYRRSVPLHRTDIDSERQESGSGDREGKGDGKQKGRTPHNIAAREREDQRTAPDPVSSCKSAQSSSKYQRSLHAWVGRSVSVILESQSIHPSIHPSLHLPPIRSYRLATLRKSPGVII